MKYSEVNRVLNNEVVQGYEIFELQLKLMDELSLIVRKEKVNRGYIDFDVKENHNKTSFPLANISTHQVEHLKAIHNQGGIAFIIVAFNLYNEYYLLPFEVLYEYWENSLKDGRKSIPYDTFKTKGYLIKEGYLPRLNYLKTIDEIYFK